MTQCKTREESGKASLSTRKKSTREKGKKTHEDKRLSEIEKENEGK